MKKVLFTLAIILLSLNLVAQVYNFNQSKVIENGSSRDANNTPSGANVINAGQTFEAHINPQYDVDWIKFYVSEPGTIHIDCDVPSNHNYDIELYDNTAPNGWLNGSYNGLGQDEHIDQFVNNTGWYYVKHYGYNGDWSATDKYYTTYTFTPDQLNVDPHIEYVKINGSTVNSGGTYNIYLNSLNETFELKIRGKNNGSDQCPANLSFLSTSFEQFTSASDKSRISYGDKSSDLDMNKYFGSEAQGGDGYADYVMVEGTDNNGWYANESNYYRLNINPKNWGNFVFHYKLVMADNTSGTSYARDPNSGDPDPIGEPSYTVTLNIQQSPGTIKVYVKDQDGVYRENAIVQRFDANWNYIDDKITNSSGYVQWTDCNANENYNFKVYWDGPASDNEFWGTKTTSVAAGSTETITIQRNLPYTYNYHVYDANNNQQTNFYLGEEVHIRWYVSNDHPTDDFGVKIRCQADRDKSGSMDYDNLSPNWVTIYHNSTGWIDFYFTPGDVGDYYIRPYETRSLTWGNDELTDSWEWWSTPAFTVNIPSGDLDITVNNVPEGQNTYPGNNGTIELYENDGTFYNSAQTNNNIAQFNAVPSGTNYFYKVFHNPGTTPFPQEYWGKKDNVIINTGQTTSSSFTRNMPFGLWDDYPNLNVNIQVIDINSGQFVTWGNVYTGTPLQIIFTAKNPNTSTKAVKQRLLLKKDNVVVKDETSNYENISSNGTKHFVFYYTPTQAGDYFYALGTKTQVEGSYVYTDTWPYNGPLFTAVIPTGDLEVTVNNVLGGNPNYPGTYGVVNLFDASGSQIASQNTNSNNIALFQNITTGTGYSYKVYNNPGITLFGQEYWGNTDNITIQLNNTTQSTFTRYMPYGDSIAAIAEGNDVSWSDVTAGTQLEFRFIVKNNDNVLHNVKTRFILDRDKDVNTNFDFDQTSSIYSIQPGGSYTFTFNYTPSDTGQYYSQVGVLTFVDNNYVTTDGWAWSENPFITVQPSLTVRVYNVDSSVSPVPGNYGEVKLYHANPTSFFASQQTTNGDATFINVPTGDYFYEVVHDATGSSNPTIFGEEYWGQKSTFTLNYQPSVNPDEFYRYMPYEKQAIQVLLGNQNILNWEVEVGTQLNLKTLIENGDVAMSHDVKSRIVIQQTGASNYDFDSTSAAVNIPPLSQNLYSTYWTPQTPGQYEYAIAAITNVNNSDKVTDGWSWNPLVTVYDHLGITMTEPSVNVNGVIGDQINIDWTSTGPSYTAISLYYDEDSIWNNGNETLIADGLPMTGPYQWETSNMNTGIYYIAGKAFDGQNEQIDYSAGTVTLSAVPTEFDNNYFKDFSTNVDRPYLMKARLVEQGSGDPVAGVKVDFLKLENGNWVLINDNEIAFNNGITDDDGVARCWYVPPANAGTQTVRIEWNGNTVYGAANGQNRICTVNIPEYVYMVYMAGDDPGDVGNSIWKHFKNSIMNVIPNSNVNVYVYLDRDGNNVSLYNTDDWEDSRVFIISETNGDPMYIWNNPQDYVGKTMFYTSRFLSNDNDLFEEESGKYYTLYDFINNVMERNPQVHDYILVGQTHGAGFHDVFEDRSPSFNSMTPLQIRINVLENIKTKYPNNTFKVIGLHACFMGEINTINEWKDYTDYLVTSSEETTFSKGILLNWHHKKIVDYISEHRTSFEIANKMVNEYNFGFNYPFGQIISSYDLSSIDLITSELNDLFTELKGMLLNPADRILITNSFSDHKIKIENILDRKNFPYIDLGGLLINLKYNFVNNPSIQAKCNSILDKIKNQLIVSQKYNILYSFYNKLGTGIPYYKNYEKHNVYWMYDYLYKYGSHRNLLFKQGEGYDEFLIHWLDTVRPGNNFNLVIQNGQGNNNPATWYGKDIYIKSDDLIVDRNRNHEIPSGIKWIVGEIDMGNGWQTLPSIDEDDPENDGKDRNADGNWQFVFHSDLPDMYHNFEGNLNNENVRFRVMAMDSAHNKSAWVESGVIKIDNTKPGAPVYNTPQNVWFNSNPLLDIDFEDYLGSVIGGKIEEIKYNIDNNGGNWQPITSDGTNEILSFNGPAYNNDWKISDADWQNLTLTSQGKGYHYIYFKITDAAGNIYTTGSQDEAFKFGKDVYPPVLTYYFPEENQVINNTTVTIMWNVNDIITGLALSGVDKVYYALDQNVNYTQVDPNNNMVTFTGLNEGQHTFYAYATDVAGNTSAVNVLHFTINTSINPPEDFSLLSPTNNSTLTTFTPLFEWEATIDPDGTNVTYEIWYADNPNYDNVITDIINDGTTQYQPSLLSDNSTYYWKVKAVDDDGQVKWSSELDWHIYINSANDAPNTFNLVDPVNEITLNTLTPTLNWEYSNDIDPNDEITYVLWVSQDMNFNNYDEYTINQQNNFYTITNQLNYNTTYYWKVKAVDLNGAETWSSQTNWWFKTPSEINQDPNTFNLLQLADNYETQDLRPTFEWESTNDPEGTSVNYELWYSDDPNFINATVDSNLTTTQKQIDSSLNDNTIYYWKVKAKDQDNKYRWSNQIDWKFIVNTQNDPPQPFSLMLPDTGTTVTSLLPEFSWFYSYDIDPLDSITYTLWVGTDSNYVSGSYFEYTNINDPFFTITDTLLRDTTYYWKVKAIDNHGAITWSNQTYYWFETPDCFPVTPGVIGNNDTICYNGIPTAISFNVLPTGGDGTFTYQWQDSTSNSHWQDIDSATSDIYQPNALQQTTYYRIKVSSLGGCADVFSNEIEIFVYDELLSGTITQDQTICFNTVPAQLSFSDLPTGGSANYSYQWQESTDGINFTDIPGAISQSYSPGALTQTTYYKVKVTDTCDIIYTNIITITVYDEFLANTIGNGQDICYNTVPDTITTLADATGGEGNYTYQWYESGDSSQWIAINGANQNSYQAGSLIDTTYYKCEVTDLCGTVTSNVVMVGVYDSLIPATISQNQVICYDSTPNLLTATALPQGGQGTYNYQWQDSTINGNWNNINNATNISYQPPQLTDTAFYRLLATDYCGTVISNEIEISVYDQLLPGTIGNDQIICYSTIPDTLSIITYPTGGGGIYSYQWQYSIDSITWYDISGATTPNYRPAALTQTTYYRLAVTSDLGCGSVNTNIITISVVPLPMSDAGIDDSICEDGNYQLSGYAENYSSILWSNNNGDGSFDDSTSLSAIYTPGTNDKAVGQVTLSLIVNPLTPCVNPDTDNMVLYIRPLPVADAGPDVEVCLNTPSYTLTNASAQNQSSVLWTTSGDGVFDDSTSINPTYYPGNGDINNLNVTLTMTAYANSPCTVNYVDDMLLTFALLPTSNAGIDDSICETSTYTLSGSSEHSSSILWTTTGDGVFDVDTLLTATYTPGSNDITLGTVDLILTAYANYPCTDNAIDTMNLSIIHLPSVNAGDDDTICESTTSYALSATVSGDISQTYWQTTGDGTFDDPYIVNATYFPGPGDINNEGVNLIFSADPILPCSITDYDTMYLKIQLSPVSNAGEDALICENQSYTLNGSAENADHIYWASQGDGTFDDPFLLNATYTPGYGDIENGSVTLTLWSYSINPCHSEAFDDMILNITKLPVANAGNDTTICENQTFELSGYAENYESVYWTTTGDGTFGDSTLLNTTYTPGINDLDSGYVNIFLTAIGLPPCYGDTTDSMILSFEYLPLKPDTPVGPTFIDLDYIQESEYTINSVENANNYSWYLIPEEVGNINGNDTLGLVTWSEYIDSVAYVYVDAVNNCGYTSSDSLKIDITFNTSVNYSSESVLEIKVIPNPSRGIFSVVIDNFVDDLQLLLINSDGQIILRKKITNVSNEKFVQNINVSNKPSGVYYLKFIYKKQMVTKKIIIKTSRKN